MGKNDPLLPLSWSSTLPLLGVLILRPWITLLAFAVSIAFTRPAIAAQVADCGFGEVQPLKGGVRVSFQGDAAGPYYVSRSTAQVSIDVQHGTGVLLRPPQQARQDNLAVLSEDGRSLELQQGMQFGPRMWRAHGTCSATVVSRTGALGLLIRHVEILPGIGIRGSDIPERFVPATP